MNMNDVKFAAHQILDEAFKEKHPVKRKAHLQMLNAMVTFNDRVERYEYVLEHPQNFERIRPDPEKVKLDPSAGYR